ncbi:MAG TPA: hypothetical protein PKB09_01880 [Candidatus Saccharibacteria bacterium]|nr:hypothetical protein [Candidatus Saccharibacteria bacterium]
MSGNFDFSKGTSRFESRVAEGEGDNTGDVSWWGSLSHSEVTEAAQDIWRAGHASWGVTGNPIDLSNFSRLADSFLDDRWSLHALHLVSRINLKTAHQAYETALEDRIDELERVVSMVDTGISAIIDKFKHDQFVDQT